MTMFTFKGFSCVEVAVAFASCVVGALCVAFCHWPEAVAPPVCVWSAVCVTSFALPAAAVAPEEFVWVTGPSSPGLSTLTTTFTFVGETCVELAAAAADCVVGALWVAA
jgi:hypothetical protein